MSTRWYKYCRIFNRLESIEVMNETGHFLTTKVGDQLRKVQKISSWSRWFPTKKEAIEDATNLVNSELVKEYQRYLSRLESLQEQREKLGEIALKEQVALTDK